MDKRNPHIRIQYSWLLENALFSRADEETKNSLPSPTETEKIAEDYRLAWQALENKILTGLRDLTGLEFWLELIDVYVAPRTRAFSEPLVIGTHYEPDMAIDVLTHELIHKLLTDNTKCQHNKQPSLKHIFNDEMSDHVETHVIVHAIHKAIYLDVLQEPSRLERDLENCRKLNAQAYLESWEYVEKYGYQEVIEKVKKAYQVTKS